MLLPTILISATLLAGGFVPGEQVPLSFDVASVKPAAPCCSDGQWRESKAENDRVDFRYVTLKYCVAFAYRLKEFQVAGPPWLNEARYDIVAKGPEGTRHEQLPDMMRALLAERFQLRAHREKKDFSVFVLLPGKNGPRLKTASEEPGGPEGAAFGFSMGAGGVGKMVARHCDMTALANTLPRLVGRPVVDQTGIVGRFDFELEFSPEDMGRMGLADPAIAAPPGEFAQSIFTTIQQIGLKLDPQKLPLDIVVVDTAEKAPSGN